MSARPPFDPVRAAFYLVAFVIVVHAIVALAAMGACIYYSEIIIKDPNISCDPKQSMSGLLAAALAAALAFAGGYMRGKKDDNDKEDKP